MWDQVQEEWGGVGDGGTRRALDRPRELLQKGTQTEKGSSLGDRKVEQRRGGVLNNPAANLQALTSLAAHSLLGCPLQKGKDEKFKKLNCY